MASLNAKVLKRVDSIKFGDVGAVEGSCSDVGSCREAMIRIEAEQNVATDAAAGDAVVDVAFSGVTGTMTLIMEDITKENVASALGGTVDGTGVVVAGNMQPVYQTAYIRGAYMDGTPVLWHVKRFFVKPGAELKLGKEQMLLEIECILMANTDGELFESTVVAADTTAPTVSSVSPADAATGVAVSANVVWTFSEAITADDVDSEHFFVSTADGSVIAGALSHNGTDTVTFNPTSNLAGSTAHIAVAVAGVRDLAGNKLAATSVTNFTTA